MALPALYLNLLIEALIKFTKSTLILCLFLLATGVFAQGDGADRTFYKNGNPKLIVNKHGADTIEVKTYYKNGQLKDSAWLYIATRDEIPFGTAKKFYSNGTLQALVKYGSNDQEYTSYEYRKNGRLERFTQRPTGLTKFYNKRGKQIREYDYNKLVHVYVPLRFKNGIHLNANGYANRIKYKSIALQSAKKNHTINKGLLVSLKLKSDTALLNHCLIEGFANDTLYYSVFHYNPDYRNKNDFDILKYDYTKAVALKNVETVYYSRHKNARRHFGALVTYVVGYDVLFIPVATLPLFIRSANDGSANIPKVVAAYAGLAAVGIPLVYWGKYLLITTVPKKVNLKEFELSYIR